MKRTGSHKQSLYITMDMTGTFKAINDRLVGVYRGEGRSLIMSSGRLNNMPNSNVDQVLKRTTINNIMSTKKRI